MRLNKEWMVPKCVSQVTEWVVKLIKIVRERRKVSLGWGVGWGNEFNHE